MQLFLDYILSSQRRSNAHGTYYIFYMIYTSRWVHQQYQLPSRLHLKKYNKKIGKRSVWTFTLPWRIETHDINCESIISELRVLLEIILEILLQQLKPLRFEGRQKAPPRTQTQLIGQRCTNSGRQVPAATKFCTVAQNNCESSRPLSGV